MLYTNPNDYHQKLDNAIKSDKREDIQIVIFCVLLIFLALAAAYFFHGTSVNHNS